MLRCVTPAVLGTIKELTSPDSGDFDQWVNRDSTYACVIGPAKMHLRSQDARFYMPGASALVARLDRRNARPQFAADFELQRTQGLQSHESPYVLSQMERSVHKNVLPLQYCAMYLDGGCPGGSGPR